MFVTAIFRRTEESSKDCSLLPILLLLQNVKKWQICKNINMQLNPKNPVGWRAGGGGDGFSKNALFQIESEGKRVKFISPIKKIFKSPPLLGLKEAFLPKKEQSKLKLFNSNNNSITEDCWKSLRLDKKIRRQV